MTSFFSPSPSLRWSWVSLAGPDALDFLHRLTTVNVRALAVGRGAPGCFLTAQGKLRAFFTLWRYGEDEFAFELDAGADGAWKTRLLATIEQFTFAEKMTVTDVSEHLECVWVLGDAGSWGLAPGETRAIENQVRLCRHADAEYGTGWISAWARPSELRSWLGSALAQAAPLDFAQLEELRIAALRPRIGTEIDENTNPLEVGLIDAIAENKGCYPGQEVIEKVISLGSPPRRLALLEGAGPPPAAGARVFNSAEPPVEVGGITSASARPGGGFQALAVLRKIHAQPGLEVKLPDGREGKVLRLAPYSPQSL